MLKKYYNFHINTKVPDKDKVKYSILPNFIYELNFDVKIVNEMIAQFELAKKPFRKKDDSIWIKPKDIDFAQKVYREIMKKK